MPGGSRYPFCTVARIAPVAFFVPHKHVMVVTSFLEDREVDVFEQGPWVMTDPTTRSVTPDQVSSAGSVPKQAPEGGGWSRARCQFVPNTQRPGTPSSRNGVPSDQWAI